MLGIKLGIKNISKKKMIMYCITICILVIGTVFYIYKIFNIAPEVSTIESSLDMSLFDEFSETAADSEDFISRISAELTKTIRPLEISIFNSSKFKILKEMIFKEVKIEAGKENPFENLFEISNK